MRFAVGECYHTFNNDDDANLPLSQEEPLRAVHVVYLPGAAAAARVRVAIIARVPKKKSKTGGHLFHQNLTRDSSARIKFDLH